MDGLKLDQFLDYTYLSNPELSPNGKTAAFVAARANTQENRYDGSIWLLEDGRTRRLTGMDKERSFLWEDDTHILFPAVRSDAEKKKAERKLPFTAYYRIDIHGGEAVCAFTVPFGAEWAERLTDTLWCFGGGIDAAWPDLYQASPEELEKYQKAQSENADYTVVDEVPWWFNGEGVVNKKRTAIFTYDTVTGEVRRITGPMTAVHFRAVLNGTLYFAAETYTTLMTQKDDVFSFDPVSGAVEPVLTGSGLWIYELAAYDGELLVAGTSGARHGANENLWLWTLTPGQALTPLFTGDLPPYSSVGSDCRLDGGKEFRIRGSRIYLTATLGGASRVCILDRTGTVTEFTHGEGSVDSFDVLPDGGILAVHMQGTGLQELCVSGADGILRPVTDFNGKALADRYVSDYTPLTVSSQGWDISGWVLLPNGYDPAQTYPAILDIHGGPKTVYGQVFYHEMQYWAGRGYFVFFCNPFGSDGRGNDFTDMRGKYGTTDYENLMDFTDAVLNRYPQIDRSRVCVTGGSYGGFMTNWIIGHTDRFCCAATQRSIMNWESFAGISDIGPDFTENEQNCSLDDHETLWAHSPLSRAKYFRTPTLIIHSDEDYRCPIAEGYQLLTALITRGVEARMCVFHGENHELSRSGKPLHRVRRLREISDWFDRHVGI